MYEDKTFNYYADEERTDLKGDGYLKVVANIEIEDEGRTRVFITPERQWHFRFESTTQKDFWIGAAQNASRSLEGTVSLHEMDGHKTNYALTVLGMGAVGKSSLVLRFTHDIFPEGYDPTIEDEYRVNSIVDGKMAILNITDTAGQEEFSFLADAWIRESEGVVLVFAVNDRSSFEELSNLRDKVISLKEDETFPMCLCGNKTDLKNQRQVSTHDLEKQAEEFGCLWVECSAKANENVPDSFLGLVRLIRKRHEERRKEKGARADTPKKCVIL